MTAQRAMNLQQLAVSMGLLSAWNETLTGQEMEFKTASFSSLKVIGRVIFYPAGLILLVMIGACDHAAYAQGLVGAAVDPAFGQANEIGQMADYGYDCARDISRVLTALSTIPSVLAGAKIAFNYNHPGNAIGNPLRAVLTGMTVAFGGPTVVHLLGTFAINNYGGLGGGL